MSLMAAAVGVAPTPSIFAPVSTPAFAIRELSFLVLAIVRDLKHPDDPDGPHE